MSDYEFLQFLYMSIPERAMTAALKRAWRDGGITMPSDLVAIARQHGGDERTARVIAFRLNQVSRMLELDPAKVHEIETMGLDCLGAMLADLPRLAGEPEDVDDDGPGEQQHLATGQAEQA
jgi:hypothetical protein